MLGKVRVRVRTQYSQRPYKKLQFTEDYSFGWYVKNMQDLHDGKPTDDSFNQLVSSSTDPLYVAKSKIPLSVYYNLGFPVPPVDEKDLKNPIIWCGPGGSGSSLHFDHFDNFALQIIGEKKWKIVPPYNTIEAGYQTPPSRYFFQKVFKEPGTEPVWTKIKTSEPSAGFRSLLPDIRKLIDQTGPLELTFKTSTETKKISVDVLVTTLKPMEMLYLPAYFGHAVTNLTMSCMLNFFSDGVPALLE